MLLVPLCYQRGIETPNVQICRKISPKCISLLIKIYLINFDFLWPLKLWHWSNQHDRFIQKRQEQQPALTVGCPWQLYAKNTKAKHKQTITNKGLQWAVLINSLVKYFKIHLVYGLKYNLYDLFIKIPIS